MVLDMLANGIRLNEIFRSSKLENAPLGVSSRVGIVATELACSVRIASMAESLWVCQYLLGLLTAPLSQSTRLVVRA